MALIKYEFIDWKWKEKLNEIWEIKRGDIFNLASCINFCKQFDEISSQLFLGLSLKYIDYKIQISGEFS